MIPLTFPFAKDSPFLESFKKVLFEMKKTGIVKQIWNRHKTLIDDVCEERKVNCVITFLKCDST